MHVDKIFIDYDNRLMEIPLKYHHTIASHVGRSSSSQFTDDEVIHHHHI